MAPHQVAFASHHLGNTINLDAILWPKRHKIAEWKPRGRSSASLLTSPEFTTNRSLPSCHP